MNHNLNDPRHPWTRLTAAARHVPDDRDTTAPYGFTTRVAALALSSERKMGSLFDRFALRALGVSCLLALGSVAMNYQSLTSTSTTGAFAEGEEEVLSNTDAVAVILDLAD